MRMALALILQTNALLGMRKVTQRDGVSTAEQKQTWRVVVIKYDKRLLITLSNNLPLPLKFY